MNITLDKLMLNKEFLDKVRYVLRGNKLPNIAHCSQSPHFQYTNIWANGRKGSIVCDILYGSTYRFYEDGKDTETKDAEIVCTGFVGFLISNSNNLLSIADNSSYDLVRDFYDSFISQIIQHVKDEMRLKPGFWKLTDDNLYYQKVVAQDTYESLIEESKGIFEYLTPEERVWIKAYVQDYIEYINNVVLPRHGFQEPVEKESVPNSFKISIDTLNVMPDKILSRHKIKGTMQKYDKRYLLWKLNGTFQLIHDHDYISMYNIMSQFVDIEGNYQFSTPQFVEYVLPSIIEVSNDKFSAICQGINRLYKNNEQETEKIAKCVRDIMEASIIQNNI